MDGSIARSYMHELTILFLHHAANSLTRSRIASLQRLNPGVPIVPLVHRSDDKLPDGFDAAALAPEFAGEHWWHGTDVMLYAWHRHARTAETTAHRYAVIEYDMLFTVPLADFYREVWDADLAGGHAMYPHEAPDWPWFKETDRLPEALRPFAAGMAPLAGSLIANRVLAAISTGEIPPDVFSEFRLGTLTRSHGFHLANLPEEKCRNLSYAADLVDLSRPTPVYHPVKTLLSTEMELAPA
jgi:hypothetical protein